MGGSAYLIRGHLQDWRREAVEGDLGEGLIDLDAGPLGAAFVKAFREYLGGEIRKPWPATKTALGYIKDSGEAYLRGDKLGWYVQVSFSGNAGMSGLSAELATHWAGSWLAAELEELAQTLLLPQGFEPAESWRDEVPEPPPLFVPTRQYGYAGLHPEYGYHFDEWVTEPFEDEPEEDEESEHPLVTKLAAQADFLSDGACRCQLCMPDFDPNTLSF